MRKTGLCLRNDHMDKMNDHMDKMVEIIAKKRKV